MSAISSREIHPACGPRASNHSRLEINSSVLLLQPTPPVVITDQNSRKTHTQANTDTQIQPNTDKQTHAKSKSYTQTNHTLLEQTISLSVPLRLFHTHTHTQTYAYTLTHTGAHRQCWGGVCPVSRENSHSIVQH